MSALTATAVKIKKMATNVQCTLFANHGQLVQGGSEWALGGTPILRLALGMGERVQFSILGQGTEQTCPDTG